MLDMKKIAKIISGTLLIIAGALSLMVSLVWKDFVEFDYTMIISLILSVGFIGNGTLVLLGKMNPLVLASITILCIIVQFIFESYINMGAFQMVLLFIASIFLFVEYYLEKKE